MFRESISGMGFRRGLSQGMRDVTKGPFSISLARLSQYQALSWVCGSHYLQALGSRVPSSHQGREIHLYPSSSWQVQLKLSGYKAIRGTHCMNEPACLLVTSQWLVTSQRLLNTGLNNNARVREAQGVRLGRQPMTARGRPFCLLCSDKTLPFLSDVYKFEGENVLNYPSTGWCLGLGRHCKRLPSHI